MESCFNGPGDPSAMPSVKEEVLNCSGLPVFGICLGTNAS